ncbi:MAG: sensor domain-containing protein [Dehalococcoidales bacterium]|nr:sensor domain-containing protein [Dehalococcoidales bacterium]
MNNGIEKYLSELKKELAGSDRATIQDALSDAEEHLRTGLDSALEADPRTSPADALAAVVEKYGSPTEVAAAYKEIESRTPPAFTRPAYKEKEPDEVKEVAVAAPPDTRPFYLKFFGIFADIRAWGALLYLIFALGTGIIYFTWAVTGLSLSAGLLVLIIGVLVAGLFLLSVRGVALVEGRIVEALLGVRMPRRPLFSRSDIGWWQKIKNMLISRHTWTAIVYMVLQMPLGIIYFTVTVTLVSLSLWGIVLPITQFGFNIPISVNYDAYYYLAGWVMPFTVIGGILLLTATMHLVKAAGKLHAGWAKVMLVRE